MIVPLTVCVCVCACVWVDWVRWRYGDKNLVGVEQSVQFTSAASPLNSWQMFLARRKSNGVPGRFRGKYTIQSFVCMYVHERVCVSFCVFVCGGGTDDGGELARGDRLFGDGQVTVGTHDQLVVRDHPAGVAWGANMVGWKWGGSMACECVCAHMSGVRVCVLLERASVSRLTRQIEVGVLCEVDRRRPVARRRHLQH